MQSARTVYRPLLAQATHAVAAPSAAALRPSAASNLARVYTVRRSYATEPEQKNTMQELQAKQMRLVDKMGRRKQTPTISAQVPIFANYIPPYGGRVIPADSPHGAMSYAWHGAQQWFTSQKARLRWKKLLGSSWKAQFQERALIAYQQTNQALATGNYERLRDFASHEVVEGVKAQRTRKLQGLRMSWKLHEVKEQTILCTREQEVFKADEFIGQIAVRFVTLQSLEIRDVRNNLVGTGSHEDPQEVIEYYIYQRDMWRPEDDWKVVKRGAKETDTLADPSAQP
ncbi:hypothetical protein JCM10908_004618 [Rhodotorula pacifica]|uniref:uncharacterized protein n=1 Tax=Rhodotorula pacifica TaxID=1495444 RepID=UPI00317CC147